MRQAIALCFIFLFTLQLNAASGILIVHAPVMASEVIAVDSSSVVPLMTVDRTTSGKNQVGKKLSFTQKLALKLMQKKMRKAMKKANAAHADHPDEKRTLSKLALIFGSVGLGTLIIPYVGFIAIPCAIAGLVLGILGIKREGSNTMNILGIVFGGVTLLLIALVLILVLAFYLV